MGVPLGWVWFPIRRFSGALCLCFSANSNEKGFWTKAIFFSVNILLAILGTTRALFLFVDPYSSGENGVLNIQVAFKTCLRYSLSFFDFFDVFLFCLIHLAFLEVTKIKLGSKKLQSARFVGSVITSHFAVEIMAKVASGLKQEHPTRISFKTT